MNRRPDQKPAIVVFSSHVARGSVGARAAVFALERRGHRVWSVPTVILPYHPGHGRGARIVPQAESWTALLDDLAQAPWRGEVGAVLSGYLGSADQADAIARVVDAFRAELPGLVYCCDPVIGDEGGLYVPAETADAIRDTLVPRADIVTPNRFELDWLAGRQSSSDRDLIEAAGQLGRPSVLTTSAFPMMAGHAANLLVENGQAFLAEHTALDNPPHGPGDLLAALFLSNRLVGLDAEKALQAATASVFEVLARAVKGGLDELDLAKEQDSLIRPMAMVAMRRVLVRS